MARNKYPEETIQKITEVSARLFMEQGYDNTSIQDIINHLGGLSKGAIYHHFHSKEEILDAVMNYIYRDQENIIMEALQDSSLNGLEKLRAIIEVSVRTAAQRQAFSLSADLLRNPRILAGQLYSIKDLASELALPLIMEGIEDGSLRGLQYPQEFAEVFLLLANIWINPMVYPVTAEEAEQKCRFLQHLTRSLGVQSDLLTEKVIRHLCEYTELYNRNGSK